MRQITRLAAVLLAIGATYAQGTRTSTIDISERAIATLRIPGFVDFLVADGKAVWATNVGRIEKLELDSSQPTSVVKVPAPCGAMAVGFGSVWVANCSDDSLYRIDSASGKIRAVIPTGLADPSGELSIAAGSGSVWVLSDGKGILSRVDPQKDAVVARIQVAPDSYAAAFGFDAVWITNTGPETGGGRGAVQRIDPRSNRVVATIPVGPSPRFLTAGEGGVWTLNQGDGSISRIDPATNTLSATIRTEIVGPGGDIAAGAGSLWVRGKKVLLLRIDPKTNQVAEKYGPPAGSGAVRVADDLVWVTAHNIQTVWVLRPGNARLRDLTAQSGRPFVPKEFEVPAVLETDKFRLRMLTVDDAAKDFDAVMTSVDHLRGVFGPDTAWPAANMTLEQDRADLARHQKKFQERSSFTYTVMNLPETRCLGCVYIFPTRKEGYDAEITLWVRKSEYEKGLDPVLLRAVKKWLAEKWPFKNPGYPGREIKWEQWDALSDK